MTDENGRDNGAEARSLTKWVPVAGDWELTEAKATFRKSEEKSKFGIVLSDVRGTSGILRGRISFKGDKDSAGRILFGRNPADGTGYSVGLGGDERAFLLSRQLGDQRSSAILGLGMRSQIKANCDYQLEVRLRGQHVRLFVDEVEVLRKNLPQPMAGNQIGLLAFGENEVTFSEVKYLREKPRAFVVMQFGEPYDSFYTEVIKPVGDKLGFDVRRGDDVSHPGIILQDIVNDIQSSDAIIAEVTPPNPNVFYEIGFAHAVGTPTILLAAHPSGGSRDLPFDISGFRCIFYEDAIRGKSKVERELRQHLESILEHADAGSTTADA